MGVWHTGGNSHTGLLSGIEHDLESRTTSAGVALAGGPLFRSRGNPFLRFGQFAFRFHGYRRIGPDLGDNDALIRGLHTASDRAKFPDEYMGVYTRRCRHGFLLSLPGNPRAVFGSLLPCIRTKRKRVYRDVCFGDGDDPSSKVDHLRDQRPVDPARLIDGRKFGGHCRGIRLSGQNYSQANSGACVP